ncbi:MAG: RNase adapter RapZ [Desulfobacterota bacterium]|nr:RNase adapter RapZ [Thermodesulfobacteriota bacterium]
MVSNNLQIVIVTGLSGSGKTTTLKALEDLGFYCVDNLPPILFPQFIELCRGAASSKITKIGLGMDIREGEFLNEYPEIFNNLFIQGYRPEVIFLESSDEVLIRRFSETRRQHPLGSKGSISERIKLERERLLPLRETASLIIDTSDYTVHDLQKKILAAFQTPNGKSKLAIHLVSFGYRYGIPAEADLVIDVRFIPNPYFIDVLRPLSGNDEKIKNFISEKPETQLFLKKFKELLSLLIPLYEQEGKSNLTIAIGCTGGHHRSVSVVNLLRSFFDENNYSLTVYHRDIDKV